MSGSIDTGLPWNREPDTQSYLVQHLLPVDVVDHDHDPAVSSADAEAHVQAP